MVTIRCLIEEGIVFALKWDDEESPLDEGRERKFVSTYENYAKEILKRSKYQHIRIILERLNRSIALIESSWQRTSRHYTLKELGNLLNRQHELENNAENIEDIFLREYIYEQLDMIAAARRYLTEEIRWDIESSKKS